MLKKLFTFYALMFVMLCANAQIPTNGLVAWYPFTGNAIDSSGNGNNGTVNGASLTTDRFGKTNSAYNFNGINSYIVVKGNSQLFTKEYTVSIWFSPNKNASQNEPPNCLLRSGNSTNCGWQGFELAENHSNIRYGFQDLGNSYYSYSSTIPISYYQKNKWYNITFTRTSNKAIEYFNGQPFDSISNSIYDPAPLCDLFIGSNSLDYNNQPWNVFDGKVDDGRMYNRALSSKEVLTLYHEGGYNMPCIGITGYNPFQDTLSLCGENKLLDAGTGYKSYIWNDGTLAQSLLARASGKYKVIVTTNEGCTLSDSIYIQLVNAKITQRDTTICKGGNLTLNVLEPSFFNKSICDKSQLPTNLLQGLLAYYPFCGNANDASGSNFNGNVNNAVLDYDRFGNLNSAFSFNGINSNINISNTITNQSTNEITVSMWVNLKKINNTNSRVLLYYGNGEYAIEHDNQSIAFQVKLSDQVWYRIESNDTSYFNSWNLMTFQFKKGEYIKIYVNGILKKTGSIPNYELNNPGLPSYIGSAYASANKYSNAIIDDILIYNRILTNDEVKSFVSADVKYLWSTNDTTNYINILPTKSNSYYVTATNGNFSCKDSIYITLKDLTGYNALQDTLRICGDSITLHAGLGFKTYQWSDGTNSEKIFISKLGLYKVFVFDSSGCSTSDSSYISMVKVKINQKDTTITKGSTIKISFNPTFPSMGARYGGGIVFSLSADKKSGLICSEFDQSTNAVWGCYGQQVCCVTSNNGISNTNTIVNSCWENGAARICSDLVLNGYDDWYLPSIDELYSICINQSLIGNFSNVYYWSSTQYSNLQAHAFTLPFGAQGQIYKNNLGGVRAIRYFSNNSYKELKYRWSNGDSSNSINVAPDKTTTYYVEVTDGITVCKDSITIYVTPVNTVPLKFISFVAKRMVKDIPITWKVAEVFNIVGFDLERSFDGTSFSLLNNKPIGTAAEYSFKDNHPQKAWYRVKVNEADGSSWYSWIESVNALPLNVNIYPNPTANKINIVYKANEAGFKIIKLIDIQGKTMLTKTINTLIGNNNISIDITSITNGTYLLVGLSENGNIIIKQ